MIAAQLPFSPRPLDKRFWSDGPWQTEPDELAWIEPRTGVPCAMMRNWMGVWCGYTSVGPDHPLYRKGYHGEIQLPASYIEEILHRPVEVHRDFSILDLFIVMSREHNTAGLGTDGYLPLTLLLPTHAGLSYADHGKDGDVSWWFGFDCGHAGDLIPILMIPSIDATYRDQHYVQGQVTRLAWAIAEVQTCLADPFVVSDKDRD